jgi:hypothetical protein
MNGRRSLDPLVREIAIPRLSTGHALGGIRHAANLIGIRNANAGLLRGSPHR